MQKKEYAHLTVNGIPLCDQPGFDNQCYGAVRDYQKKFLVNLHVSCNVEKELAQERAENLRKALIWDRDERGVFERATHHDHLIVEVVDGLCPKTKRSHALLFEHEPWYDTDDEDPRDSL